MFLLFFLYTWQPHPLTFEDPRGLSRTLEDSRGHSRTLDAPTLEPYLTALLGEGYRLDHDYLAVLDPVHSGRLGLHGGGHGAGGRSTVGATDGGQCFYHQHQGRFFNGLVGVAIELNTVGAGDGGFACV